MAGQDSISQQNSKVPRRDRAWPFWPVVPLYPYGQRPTLRQEVVPDTIWTFDQYQGIFYVVVPIRMTVVRLQSGGLLVYAPVAPTGECVAMMRSLEARYGSVRYIIQSTTTGIEHKVFVGPFARRFPQAQIYVAPDQWSFPINLPLSWLGLPARRTQVLTDDRPVPFADEFDWATLGPIKLGLGPFVEVALFHRATRTLLLTDALVSVPNEPPAVLHLDPYPLLFHARDRADEAIVDTPEARRRGWHRIALFAFFFQPNSLDTPTLGTAFKAAKAAPDRSRRAYFGLYPFCWQADWAASFEALHGGGRPFVAPVLQTLIFNRGLQELQAWVEQVSQWHFERVIPCHLTAPIALGPAEFRAAFATILQPQATNRDRPLPAQDFAFLKALDAGLVRRGITPPADAVAAPNDAP
ncbi:DUF4336 domain-containing protein [Halomicronema sp. CCY15110]|uniref:DUF4336 domain-containing protein n=1 Tax=Halomicronema sp. CCY15110 TaxID=2767773 RepID=UPI00194DBB17|nr:DUF4336 domain-containing protein [Halomicronema sp. CCY15110]